MKNRFHKLLSIIIIIASVIGFLSLLPTPTFAETDVCSMKDSVAPEVYKAAGCDKSNSQLPNVITIILYGVIGVSGIVAVIYIIIGGVGYMTSTGDANKVEKAKKTILYACIGLAICALAFAIVNWVIGGVLKQ